ncbi:MAG: hypothetical protein V4692_03450 [Bdellovibrionota bacterium]
MVGRHVLKIVFGTSLVFASLFAQAAEPAFCDPTAFKKLEITQKTPGLVALHMYKVGSLHLAGLAVGNSKTPAVQQLAAMTGRNLSDREKSCTWYMNDGNREAIKAFNQRFVERPTSNIEKSVEEYERVLQSSFDKDAVNMVSCAEENQYVALGCDGMRHRGPSVFAMVLAFAGCDPTRSVQIANSIWGTNGIPTATRVALAQRAYELGSERSDSRARLQAVMTAK